LATFHQLTLPKSCFYIFELKHDHFARFDNTDNSSSKTARRRDTRVSKPNTQFSAFNASACRAYGRGVQPTGVRMREKADFHVSTAGAGDAPLKVNVKGPREYRLY